MFNLPSVRIGRFFGIPVEVNATWFVIFILVAVLLSFSYFPLVFEGRPLWIDVTNGIVTAILFFASVVVHELSHSLVAKAGGIKISKITLFIFGGVAQMEEEPETPKHEAVMAFAGPGMSMLLAALFYLAFLSARGAGVSNAWWGPLEYLAFINLAVGLFNLVPGFPLDGGRVLRAGIWAVTKDLLKATRWASRSGQFFGYALIALAVFGLLQGFANFLWFGLIGWFISSMAQNAYQQQVVKTRLGDVKVRDLMSPDPVVVPADITLEQLAHDFFLGQRHSRYPVKEDGHVVGVITLATAKSVPRDRWPDVQVGEVANRDLDRLVVEKDSAVDEVLDRLGPEDSGALLVVDDGDLAGVLTRSDVIRKLRVSEALGD